MFSSSFFLCKRICGLANADSLGVRDVAFLVNCEVKWQALAMQCVWTLLATGCPCRELLRHILPFGVKHQTPVHTDLPQAPVVAVKAQEN